MLSNLRASLRPTLEPLGLAAAATGVPPIGWTALSLVFGLLAALVYAWHPASAPVAGGVLLLVSGLFDVLDGHVARATHRASERGALLDSASDKISETAVFLGILVGGTVSPALVFLAATLSLLVGYARARAESLGVPVEGIGPGERAERLLVVALVGMTGRLDWAVTIVIVIAAATFVQRTLATLRRLPHGAD